MKKITLHLSFVLPVLLLVGVLFANMLTISVARASTSILSPVSVGTSNGGWIPLPNPPYANTNANRVTTVQTNDGDTSYIRGGSVSDYVTYLFSNAEIPAGSTINSVTLNVVAKKPSSDNDTIVLRATSSSGTNSDPAATALTTSYATYSRTMTTNPFTLSTWTLSEVNAWTVRFGVKRGSSFNNVPVTQIYLTVDYTPTSVLGCTDPAADNYNPAATQDDGSCMYTGAIQVTKNTVGADGTFSFDAGNAGEFEISTEGYSGSYTIDGLEPDEYSVEEDTPEGWELTENDCEDVVVVAGETTECTITNTKLGKIIVEKITNPESDTSFDFIASYYDGDFSLSNGEEDESDWLTPGTYSVSEEENNDYITNVVCSDGSDPEEIELNAGETVTCAFTNTLKQAGLTIVKITNPSDTDQEFEFDLSWEEEDVDLTLGSSDSEFYELDPGTYSVNEVNLPEGWDLTDAVCSNDDDPSEITLGPDEEVVCTFTNTQRGYLVVYKITDPEDQETAFPITIYGEGEIFGDETNDLYDGSPVEYEVSPGTYSVEEDTPEGWELWSNTCEDVSVGAGETVECTIVNVIYPVLTIEKYTQGADGEFDFTVSSFNNGGSVEDVTVETEEGTGSKDVTLGEGTHVYDVVEDVPSGWELTNVVCEYDGEEDGSEIENGVRIYVDNGDHVICTFYNVVTEGGETCEDESANNFGDELPCLYNDEVPSPDDCPEDTAVPCFFQIPVLGCTDPKANNFDPDATEDDGSCVNNENNDEGSISGGFMPTSGGQVLGTSTDGQVLGVEKFVFTLFLRMGPPYPSSQTNEVMELQKLLNSLGHNCGPVDGKFGPLTRACVVRFQVANGLVGDGIVGPLTRAVLNSL